MTRKPLGQIAYEAAFSMRPRRPYAHDDYPRIWDDVAKAVERAVRRNDNLNYEATMREWRKRHG